MSLARALLREHAPLVGIVGAHLAFGYALQAVLDVPIMDLQVSYGVVNIFVALWTILFLSGHAFWSLRRVPEGQSVFAFIWSDLRTRWLTPHRLAGYAIVHLTLPFFMSTFQCVKLAIPVVRPFDLDPTFHAWDVALHLGRAPWEWLDPLLGGDAATLILNVFYNLWFFGLFGTVIWQGFAEDRRLRAQFFIAFLLTFIVGGNVLAMAMSSVGPCFYGLLMPDQPDPYVALMERLHDTHSRVPLWAVDVQDQLWTVYTTGEVGTVAGISAMPSMHVAASTLFMLLGWARNKWLGAALTVFWVLILIGSVHLAWHYAIDGYLGAAVAAGIWFGAGWLVKRTPWLAGAHGALLSQRSEASSSKD